MHSAAVSLDLLSLPTSTPFGLPYWQIALIARQTIVGLVDVALGAIECTLAIDGVVLFSFTIYNKTFLLFEILVKQNVKSLESFCLLPLLQSSS